MKICAFQGSPRVHGNSDILLREALKPLEEAGHEIRLFHLNTMNIKPCQDCGGCERTGRCIIKDQMEEVCEAIRDADRIIVASPVFFFGLSAQAKTMVDRCQAFWCEKYLLRKPIPHGPHGRKGLLLLVGGMKKQGASACAEETSKAFFRTVNVPHHAVLFFGGIDAKGDILKHPTALQDAYRMGKELIQLS